MRKLLLALVLVAPVRAAEPVTFHVATTGDNQNPGTASEPFATIKRAQEEVRTQVAAGLAADVTVLIHGGTYELIEPLTFGAKDSGTDQHSITYAAAPGETPILSGGRNITGWKKDKGEIWTVELPAVKSGHWTFRNLFVNGQRATPARYPNATADPPYVRLSNSDLSKDLTSWKLYFDPSLLPEDKDLTGAEAVILCTWDITKKRIQTEERATGVLTLVPPHARSYASIEPHRGNFCYFEGGAALLDQPGEWYLDRQNGVLAYWPRPGEDLATTPVVAPVLSRLIDVTGALKQPVRNLHFRGLNLCYTDWQLPATGYTGMYGGGVAGGRVEPAVLWNYTAGCSLEDGQLAHLGGSGILMLKSAVANEVSGNHIFDIAGNGIWLSGPENPKDGEIMKGNRFVNNHLQNCATAYSGCLGIYVSFAGETVVAHNTIHDLPYTGICVSGASHDRPTPSKNNLVEFNHVYDIGKVLGDGGAIYTCGFQPGTVVRGNLIHDIEKHKYFPGQVDFAIYLDDRRGILVDGNIIYNIHNPQNNALKLNGTTKENIIWGTNTVSVTPDRPNFPTEAAAKAGVEPAYRERLLGTK